MSQALSFVNREEESALLTKATRAGGLVVVYGRRRVGKTRFLVKWTQEHHALYSQAIEGAPSLQIDQVFNDLQPHLKTSIVPKTWIELFDIIKLNSHLRALCLDEFPYLVLSDPTLPSVLQKWIDHQMPPRFLFILAGSSNRMMHDLFLNETTPLYGRAERIMHLTPMSYATFCKALHLKPDDIDSFILFSLVGGIPKYWELLIGITKPIEAAETLFLGFAPYMENEPHRLLKDETFGGRGALSLLEAIGRGASKPSEIGSRLQMTQTNLSHLFEELQDAALVERQLPFGESTRTSKRTLYDIMDPSLKFWFSVYSPHRSRWRTYKTEEKNKLLLDHASKIFENTCRSFYPGATRYWEANVELDVVRSDPTSKSLIVSEVKFMHLSQKKKQVLVKDLEARFLKTKLKDKYPNVQFEVIDAGFLSELATHPSR